MQIAALVFIALKKHVVAIERASGREVWRQDLGRKDDLITLVLDGDLLIAYASGHLFGLDPGTGRIVWENDLPGLGYGHCIIAGSNAGTQAANAHALIAASQTASGPDG